MQTLLEYGLANLAAASALAVVAFGVGCVVRRPAVRHAFWLIVFIRLILPPIWTVPIEWPEQHQENPIVAKRPEATIEPVLDDPERVNAFLLDPIEAPETIPAPSEVVSAPAVQASESLDWRDLIVLAGFVWLAGSAVVLTRSVRRIYKFRFALHDAQSADGSLQQQADALARSIGLRNAPPILIVPGRVSPSLWMPGFRPRSARLIFPAELLQTLDDEQRTAVLAHELAHLRRGDPWVRWLELICCVLYWWFPLLGWFRRELRDAEEQCCDMQVVAAFDSRRAYASALVETAVFLDGSNSIRKPLLASGAGPVRNLQRRVTMIMRATWPARLTRLGLAAVLGFGGLSLAFGPAIAQEGRKEKDRKDPVVGDKERPRDPMPKERGRGDRDPDRERPRDGSPELDEARAALEKARRVAREAMNQVAEAEARLAKLEGRPVPPAGRPPVDRPPVDRPREGGDRIPPVIERPREGDRPRDVGDRAPAKREPMRPGAEGPRDGGIRDLQQQIEELRRALEDMRHEMRREGDRRPDELPRKTRPAEDLPPKRPADLSR